MRKTWFKDIKMMEIVSRKADLNLLISDFKVSDLNDYTRSFKRKLGVKEGKYLEEACFQKNKQT